jgi:XTP/dITP diphosphohydrolase
MSTMWPLVLGTHNAKKLEELREWLPADRFALTSLAQIPEALVVDETGTTFQENAALKATEQARHLGSWVLAEDSGISVAALEGRPGVYSARYAGPDSDDAANNARLLEELAGVPDERRDAFYTCQLCLADPEGRVRLEATGRCHGRIGGNLTGTAGFGYDPLFIVPEYHQSFGQLGPVVKRALSHRSRALRSLVPRLLQLADPA